jgi:hypothetical protein
MDAALPAGKEAMAPFEGMIAQFAEFQRQMKEEADKLNHPTPADLSGAVLPPKMTKKALETPTNALLRIGNFLGSSQSMVAALNQRKVQLLSVIAANTKPRPASRQSSFVGDAEPTFFPVA